MYRYVGNDPVNLIDSEGRKASQASDGANFLYYNSRTGKYLKASEVTDITKADFVKIVFAMPAFGFVGSIWSSLSRLFISRAITAASSEVVITNTIDFADNFSGVVGGPTTGLPPYTPAGGVGYGAGTLFNEVKRACE